MKHVRRLCLEPRWRGPLQVILVTNTSVKCEGLPNWIHAAHTQKTRPPYEEVVTATELQSQPPVPSERCVRAEECAQGSQRQSEITAEPVVNEMEIATEDRAGDPVTEDSEPEEEASSEVRGGPGREWWPESSERLRAVDSEEHIHETLIEETKDQSAERQ